MRSVENLAVDNQSSANAGTYRNCETVENSWAPEPQLAQQRRSPVEDDMDWAPKLSLKDLDKVQPFP